MQTQPDNERGRPCTGPAISENFNLTSSVTAPLRITGEVYVDLTDVDEHKARNRVYYALNESPAGALVVIYVGPLTVNYEVLPMVWQYGQHVDVKIIGHARAVGRWVEALRNGLGVIA